MLPDFKFICPTPKCGYAIAADGLNRVKLKALRRWVKTCPKCGNIAKFIEQTSLPNIQTLSKSNGGTQNAKANQTLPKTQSQKRKSARTDGRH